MKQPKDRMRGRGWDYDGCAIEFGDEPEHFWHKIVYEKLPPAKQCGTTSVNRGQKL